MIRIRTLGSLTVSRDETLVSGTGTQARRLAVLALVARAGSRGITRERLLALLWPDGEEQASRAALSQALHALRRDLGSDEVFLGVQTLRLNEAIATCDVLEFEGALADGDWERAVAAYGGPFLEGFRVGGAAELDRWVEEERVHLAHAHAEAVERLARAAAVRGDAPAAVRWWRRRAALDPLNARATVELMRALDAAGERAAALQQARVYEALLAQELSLPPDAEVVKYAEALRSGTAPVAARPVTPVAEPLPTPAPPAGIASGEESARAPAPMTAPARRPVRLHLLAAGLAFAALAAALLSLRRPGSAPEDPLLAVGQLADRRAVASDEGSPAAEMLATSLARVPGVQVLSRLRVLELLDRRGGREDRPIDVAGAAREAGATELLEGDIHALPDDRLLLELRRVDLVTGNLRSAYRLEGADLFELAERASAEVAASLGRATGSGDGVGPGSRSLVAYRFYEEGLHRFAQGDFRGARGLFDAALQEDSTFAMAAFYRLRSGAPINVPAEPGELERLRTLAARASDRERLLILGTLAVGSRAPDLRAIADTFVVRYPGEVDAHYLAGYARLGEGEPAAALPYLRRVMELDSASVGRGRGRCLACEALQQAVTAYQALDSLPRAEAVARDWARRAPGSAVAWAALASVLAAADRHEEAIAARQRATTSPYDAYDPVFPAAVRLRAGEFEVAERSARALLADAPASPAGWEAQWLLAIVLRYRGRWEEAIRSGRAYLASLPPADRADQGPAVATIEALSLLESGRAADAARVWDSLARHPDPRLDAGGRSRQAVLQYTLLAEAHAGARDSAGVGRAADSAAAWAARNGSLPSRRLARHARGLALLQLADTTGAEAAFREAIWSPTMGFTRTNDRLAELLIATGRAREAVPLLQAALRGPLDGWNLYLTHTAIHGRLVRAFTALGQADSARAHRRWVERAGGRGDG